MKWWRRFLSAALIAAAVLFAAVPTASAQDILLTDVEHWEIVTYGEGISFNIRTTLPAPPTSARVIVSAAHLDTPYSVEVPTGPDSRIDLAHGISIDELNLPPFAQLSAVWEFQDAAGSTYRTEAFAIRYLDNAVPWAWAEETSGVVTVYTDGSDPRISSAAMDLATSALNSARRTLGVSGPPEIHLFVYPELSQLAQALREHGENVQDWVAAYAMPAYHTAFVSAPTGQEMIVNLQRDIPHEVMHLVLADAASTNMLPGWYSEGLSLLSAPEPDSTLSNVLQTAAQEGGLLPLAALCAPRFSGLSPQDTALAYAESESVMRYISNRFGASGLQGLLTAYANGTGCEAGVQRALGVSLAQLESQWHNDLLSQAAQTPGESSSLLPWIAAWVVSIGLSMLFIAPQPSAKSSRRAAQQP